MLKRISDIHALDAAYDLAIIGAGPAGMSAAAEASATGANVVLFDETQPPAARFTVALNTIRLPADRFSAPTTGGAKKS